MADEMAREVYKALREAQNKYTYFLLAAAGAAIALAVNQTQGTAMAWSQIPLAAAGLSWGLSFFFGCRHLAYVNSTLYANAELLRVESGQRRYPASYRDKLRTRESLGPSAIQILDCGCRPVRRVAHP